jgi:hypothetical protein
MEEGCIVIQSCDRYQPAWEGLFWSMDKFWDYEIPWPIYFCNESNKLEFTNKKYSQIRTGYMSHAGMIKKIMQELKQYNYIFYMLEDFWPTKRMDKEIFLGLFRIFQENNWDSLKVCPYHPSYYDLINTDFHFKNKKILEFSKDSKWRFSQQASFWKREVIENLVEEEIEISPQNQEGLKNTSLATEIKMDEAIRIKYPESSIYLYNYLWYPVGGVLWRGELSEIGKQLQFEMNIEKLIETKFR